MPCIGYPTPRLLRNRGYSPHWTFPEKENTVSHYYLQQVKVTQSCLTLCDSMDYTVHGILQARTLEWVAFPFSRGSSQPRDQTQVSRIAGRFFTSWATREALVFLEFSFYCYQSKSMSLSHRAPQGCLREQLAPPPGPELWRQWTERTHEPPVTVAAFPLVCECPLSWSWWFVSFA